MKLACYGASGKPIIKTIHGGDDLLAARASLGCLGVILELTIELVPRFWMSECMKAHDSLDSVLAEETDWPQQRFLVFPYGWRWYAYHGRPAHTSRTQAHSGACGGSGPSTWPS